MNAPTLDALIFDVDGTLADTEDFHRTAFNHAFAALGLDWHWDEALYERLLDVSGGRERLKAYWLEQHPEVTSIDAHGVRDTIQRIHELKTAVYEAGIAEGRVPLRPGVVELLDEAAREGVMVAIATTTSPVNVAALMRRALGPAWRHHFAVVVDGSMATQKKPHPYVYQQVLARIGVDGARCIALEDSGNGLKAATLAGLATVITPRRYTRDHDFSRALQVVPDFASVQLADLRSWHASHWSGERLLTLDVGR